MTTIDRRSFLRRSTVAASGAAISAGPLSALVARSAGAEPGGRAVNSKAGKKEGGYGNLVDMGDLWLPEGFRYVRLGEAGTKLALTKGGDPVGVLPRGHDGMASFATGLDRLVRNHENRTQPSPLGGELVGVPAYDPARFGGTTGPLPVIRLDGTGRAAPRTPAEA